jgi:nucleotide-binding universal stress UspA family protein
MDKILVATDFSETSEAALRWAVAIAQAHRAEVRLVHALRLPSHVTPYVPPPPDLDQELQRQVNARLAEIASTVVEADLEVSTDLRYEQASNGIREAAEEWGADLLVIGTKGLSGFEHLLLGSTAERVISIAPCPVLSVHPGDFDSHRNPRKVLVPTDFSDEAKRSASAALDLLGPVEGGELLLVSAYQLPMEYTAYGSLPTAWDYLQEVADASRRELEQWAESLDGRGWEVRSEVAEGPPTAVVRRLAEDQGVDLIAMGTHGRGGLSSLVLGSNAKKVVQHAPCPVLTVRRED